MQTPAKTIILVENSPPMLELYQRELSRVFQVLVFSDIDGVMEAIQTQDVSAIVMESELPSEKGWDLLKIIKQSRVLPVILCSAVDSRKRALEAKADIFLLKPVSPATLLETIRQVCGFDVDSDS
jgi:DNA-binding response OmpR family regulator